MAFELSVLVGQHQTRVTNFLRSSKHHRFRILKPNFSSYPKMISLTKLHWKYVVYLLSVTIPFVKAGPVHNGIGTPCAFRSLVCQGTGNLNSSCLDISDVCNGVKNCHSGEDENNCDNEGFVVDNKLLSTRSLEEDVTIKDITQEACAKICADEETFTCTGFQHNLQSSQCRLLDSRFTQRSQKPALRSFWITFQSSKEELLAKLPISEVTPSPIGFLQPSQDGKEEGFEAVVVDVDFDSAKEPTRAKRQTGFSFSGLFDAFTNFRGTQSPFFRSDILAKSGCGARSISFNPPQNTRNSRIVNGVDAPAGAYPWQAAVKLKDGRSVRSWCGGSIISDRLVLTAAHCIDHLRSSEFVVVVGDHDTKSDSPNEQVFEVEQYISHFNFKSSKGGHDIALVKLHTVNGQGIVFSDSVQPICLPTSESVYQSGTWCSVSGWGMQKPGSESSASSILKVASVPLLSSENCNRKEVYGNELNSITFPDGMLCAGFLEGGTDACSGDSGGPLACDVNGQFQLLGLVSWGEGCAAKNKPGVYTKVWHYLNWIQEWSQKL